MEEEAREAPTGPANADAPLQENLTEGSRRRAGSLKRKGPSGISSSSASTPSKRLAKERYPNPFPPSVHNGPITRARQSPNKFAVAAAAAAAAPQKPSEQAAVPEASGGKETAASGDLVARKDEEFALPEEPVVDAEFEAVRSRGSNVHVVPTPAGWFSWKKIHPLEERALPSFFDGKSEIRTSNIYMEIRNWIMKKFHANPQTQIELKDLSELSVGNSDMRQEVMEFLDHWGLINFHPFPSSNSDACAPETDGVAKASSLIEKLYQFEMVQPSARVSPKKMDLAPQVLPPRFPPESAIADDLVWPEGPSVEYHCNSCSADCSRKRYHCQKQADFDLCTECYSDGKFGSGMSAADFILMESAEGPGVSGGSWTDQETLLLLEALELFGENWNEIAEHVATKTKAQCILHFVQMPIEDPFLEGREDFNVILPGKTDPCSPNKDLAASDVSETVEIKSAENGDQPFSSPPDVYTRKDGSEAEVGQETCSSIAIDALKAAFQAVGSLPDQGGLLSFAEAGNPVMALAAFLVGLLEPDVATTSSLSSLKAMSEDSPGIQLATRHCFPLEDPPDDGKDPPTVRKDQPASESGEVQKEEDQMRVLNGTDESKDCIESNTENAVPMKKESVVSSEECTQDHTAKESGDLTLSREEVIPSTLKESGDLCLSGEKVECGTVTDSGDLASQGEVTQSTLKESENLSSHKEVTPSITKEARDSALPPKDKPNSDVTLLEEVKQCSEASTIVDILTKSAPVEGKEHPLTASVSSTAETRETTGEDDKMSAPNNGEKDSNSVATGDDKNISRIKRAAVTALSAAAVKAKLLANQEEDQIRQLVSLVIEKQLQKLEIKSSLFTEIESVIMRVKEQLDRTRQRLYHERSQIIAARLGLPSSSSRAPPPSLPTSKYSMSYGPAASRQPNMAYQRPPIKRP